MDLKNKMAKFNKRWNATSTDTYEEAFRKFKTRVLNIFDSIDQHMTDESISAFCQYYGIKEVWRTPAYGDYTWSTNISDKLNQENSEKEFYRLIELILSLNIRSTTGQGGYGYTYSKDILFEKIVDAVELSDVNVSITASEDGVILYPKGEKILDNELVDSPLTFFNKESAEHFIQALQFYQLKKYIKSAESLRRTLEEFLRYKLKNSKGLNANITELHTKLKLNKKDAQIRNIIGKTFSTLDQYFNENSKHNDGNIDDSENEFLIYQTGLLSRYINKTIT